MHTRTRVRVRSIPLVVLNAGSIGAVKPIYVAIRIVRAGVFAGVVAYIVSRPLAVRWGGRNMVMWQADDLSLAAFLVVGAAASAIVAWRWLR